MFLDLICLTWRRENKKHIKTQNNKKKKSKLPSVTNLTKKEIKEKGKKKNTPNFRKLQKVTKK